MVPVSPRPTPGSGSLWATLPGDKSIPLCSGESNNPDRPVRRIYLYAMHGGRSDLQCFVGPPRTDQVQSSVQGSMRRNGRFVAHWVGRLPSPYENAQDGPTLARSVDLFKFTGTREAAYRRREWVLQILAGGPCQ